MKLQVYRDQGLTFERGLQSTTVLKHWKIHNYIQKDRFKETLYTDEKSLLGVKKNKAYTLDLEQAEYQCIHNVSKVDTQVRLGKDRLGYTDHPKKKNKFNNFEERKYDFNELEKRLTNG